MSPEIPRQYSKLYIVIPVFNESENTDQLCRNLKLLRGDLHGEFEIQYIVIDDGSTDNTVEKFRLSDLGTSLTILQHDVNRGPGAAFGTAFSYLANYFNDEDWVLTMEGDNTSQLDLLKQMLVQSYKDIDVILASPYAPGGKMYHVKWHRLLLSHTANILARCLLGLREIHTLSSFYRLHRGRILKKLQFSYGTHIVESSGFEWAVEMLAKMKKMGAKIIEVPVQLDFSTRKGKSKMKIMRTINGYFRIFVHLRL